MNYFVKNYLLCNLERTDEEIFDIFKEAIDDGHVLHEELEKMFHIVKKENVVSFFNYWFKRTCQELIEGYKGNPEIWDDNIIGFKCDIEAEVRAHGNADPDLMNELDRWQSDDLLRIWHHPTGNWCISKIA